jgi:hypothetical protein
MFSLMMFDGDDPTFFVFDMELMLGSDKCNLSSTLYDDDL